MANKKGRISDEQRPMLGQSFPLGDTENGQTGVPAGEQGISNRSGDRAVGVAAEHDEDDETPEDQDEEEEDEDVDEVEDDSEDDAVEDEEDGTTDPEAEPRRPM